LSIIVDLRRFLVMEKSAAPSELNTIFANLENNQAPWKYATADRLNWANGS
jgi:Fe-S oxidoreductase